MATNTLRFHRLSRSDFSNNTTRTYNKGDLYFIYEENGIEGVIYMCKTAGTKSVAAFEQYSVVSFQNLTMTAVTAQGDRSVTYNPEDSSTKSIELTTGKNVTITDNSYTTDALKLKFSSSYNDTRNTAGATNKVGTKLFIVGATAQNKNPETNSNANCYIGTDNCLYSGGNKVLTSYTDTDRYVNSASFAGAVANNGVERTLTRAGSDTGTVTATVPIANATNGTASWGVVKSTSSTTSTSGLSACPIIDGVVYYKDTNTDTKVTAVGNHYTPTADTASQLSVDASSTTAATWNSTSLVTGVNLQRDAKGHVVGVTVDSIKMPSNPNTDTKNTAGATNSASKLFLVGATAQGDNPQTYSNAAVYEQAGVLTANSYNVGGSSGSNSYNIWTENGCLCFGHLS